MMKDATLTLTRGQLAWCLFGIAVLSFSAAAFDVASNDFSTFYRSAQAMRGLPVSTLAHAGPPQLNPPTLSLLLTSFTAVPFGAAFALWTVLGAALLIDALRRIQIRHRLSPTAWPWIVGGLLATTPAVFVWLEGPLTWPLLWLVTRAWLAETPLRSGGWLGLAVALKPPLALMAILLPWPIAGWTGLTGASISGLAISVTGWAPWAEWLTLSRHVDWLGWPHNLSLWGTVARLTTGSIDGMTLADFGTWTVGLVALVLVAVAANIVLRTAGDLRWGHALWWACFASPIGWTGYLPIALGPMLGSWPTSWLGRASLATLAFPLVPLAALGVPWHLLGTRLTASVYPVAAWCLWIAWARTALSSASTRLAGRVGS